MVVGYLWSYYRVRDQFDVFIYRFLLGIFMIVWWKFINYGILYKQLNESFDDYRVFAEVH